MGNANPNERRTAPHRVRMRKSIGRRLLALRTQHLLLGSEVAKAIGISTGASFHIEQSRNMISVEILLKLCAFYGISPMKLLPDVPKIEVKTKVVRKAVPVKRTFKWK